MQNLIKPYSRFIAFFQPAAFQLTSRQFRPTRFKQETSDFSPFKRPRMRMNIELSGKYFIARYDYNHTGKIVSRWTIECGMDAVTCCIAKRPGGVVRGRVYPMNFTQSYSEFDSVSQSKVLRTSSSEATPDEIELASIVWKHSEAKQFEMQTRVGYISARIIQLGYIQRHVTVLQEYDTQRGGESVRLSQHATKSSDGHKQNTFLYRAKSPWNITG
ncbi:hypothetical protein BJV74DRAFT_390005 [Russula compacta]|nr:hypothetical protein BJV74DRAFT_390005 [Russula compacta]